MYRMLAFFSFVLSVAMVASRSGASSDPDDPRRFVVIGVSGGLQEGFPENSKLHYRGQHDQYDDEEEVRAIFLGRALVRGVKAYLDVMEQGWRQYTPEPEQPLINSVNIVSGCDEHANEYWVYAVDSRQAMSILNNEPRFLSITPDTALVDLGDASTDETFQALARHEIVKQNKSDYTKVAIPIVVATWYHTSFVPSPPVKVIEDENGTSTKITNFPLSLAKWAGVDDADRTAGLQLWEDNKDSQTCLSEGVKEAQRRYWDGIRKAVRNAEVNRLSQEEWKANGPPFQCERAARLGVGPNQARINYEFLPFELVSIFDQAGYAVDFVNGKLLSKGVIGDSV